MQIGNMIRVDKIIPEVIETDPERIEQQIRGIDAEINALGNRITTLREIKKSLKREISRRTHYKTFTQKGDTL